MHFLDFRPGPHPENTGALRSQKLYGTLDRLVRTYCPVAHFL